MGWLARNDGCELTAVAIAPDLGERYLDTVYQSSWVEDLYGAEVLAAGRVDRKRQNGRTRATDTLVR
jgi:N-(2-amino-2-carboxyethyl)-L-glutamate synthase